MEKFQNTFEEFSKVAKVLREDCIAFLMRILKKNDKRIEWEDSEVCVTYDGGNHPEYASNPYSFVNAVYLMDDDTIALEIEDDDEYEIDRICTSELYEVCDFIDKNVLPQE